MPDLKNELRQLFDETKDQEAFDFAQSFKAAKSDAIENLKFLAENGRPCAKLTEVCPGYVLKVRTAIRDWLSEEHGLKTSRDLIYIYSSE